MVRPLRGIRKRGCASAMAVVGCSAALAALASTSAVAGTSSPPPPPGAGGSEAVTNANGSPVMHLFGALQSPGVAQNTPSNGAVPDAGLCYAESGFNAGSTVSGWAEGRCSESRTQEIEVCVEQNYGGSWHSSETCNVGGPAYKQFLRVGTKYSLVCTHDRKVRVWNWYYTPGTTPEITTGLYPTASGETRC
jgi:hypothetical protein